MPGISGIISGRSVVDCERVAEAMVGSMKHQRVYNSGTYFLPDLGVYAGWTAHGNSLAGAQAFFNERCDIALFLAGECFVDPGLKRTRKLETNGDSLVRLYEEEGEHFIEEVNGLFSGLLIDQRRGKAFLFNDRYGSERIYCHQTKDGTYFASEAKALLCVLPELRTLDEEGVAQFLTYGCTTAEQTLFRGIQLLPGASIWSFENGACRKRRYFSPESWESQPILSSEVFTTKFNDTFKRVLPRYFAAQSKIGISLTGGLDTRMIMACRPDIARDVVCYTFSGQTGETFDDRLAAQVAKVCGLEHQLLRIQSDFFSDFASHVDRTVYATDGCLGATGAHEIYFNEKARHLATVRLTGNYGSEVLRGVSTFKPVRLSRDLFNPDFNGALDSAASSLPKGTVHPVTFAAFREIPLNLFGSLAAARSEVTFRTPYLDNEIVALAYQAPSALRKSPVSAWRVINTSNALLSQIPTDRRSSPDSSLLAAVARRFFSEVTFKLDYLNNEGWPNRLSSFESVFAAVTSTLNVIGLHKYLHYRKWFRRELAEYLRAVINNSTTRQCPFWNNDFLRRMVNEHINGRKNYIREINAVLTLEAVQRLLINGFSADQSDEATGLGFNSTGNAAQSHRLASVFRKLIPPGNSTRWKTSLN